jgi:hypothetical protein
MITYQLRAEIGRSERGAHHGQHDVRKEGVEGFNRFRIFDFATRLGTGGLGWALLSEDMNY